MPRVGVCRWWTRLLCARSPVSRFACPRAPFDDAVPDTQPQTSTGQMGPAVSGGMIVGTPDTSWKNHFIKQSGMIGSVSCLWGDQQDSAPDRWIVDRGDERLLRELVLKVVQVAPGRHANVAQRVPYQGGFAVSPRSRRRFDVLS